MVYKQLTADERCEIYELRQQGMTLAAIGDKLGRNPGTISREITRNSGQRAYRPRQAQELRDERARERRNQRTIDPQVWELAQQRLREYWSPEQIAGRFSADGVGHISHETIYSLIYADKRAGGDLHLYLRCQKERRKRYASGRSRRGKIPNRTGIEERPAIVDNRARVGDWEGDLIIGKGGSQAIVSLVERKTRFTMLSRVTQKTTSKVCVAIIEEMKKMPELCKTLTLDNGLEFAGHQQITDQLGVGVYFARPYHSWERGANENTNGLVRQFVPKRASMEAVRQEDVQAYADLLNDRPRKTLDYQTPREVLLKVVKRRGLALRI
jgi:IS30 family transposase